MKANQITAKEINEESPWFFDSNKFEDSNGFHITAISAFGYQLRKGDIVINNKVSESPNCMNAIFTFSPEKK